MPTTEADPEIRLTTPRLLLRPVCERDIRFIVELGGAREVAEMTLTMPHPMSEDDARIWLAGHRTPGEHVFAIEHKGDGAFMGVIGLHAGEGEVADLGYWVGRPYWSQGYATEAVIRVVRHAFESLGMICVEAEVFANNPASARVLEKSGFTVDRELTRMAPARGGERVVIVHRLVREAFRGTLRDAAPPV